jgi:hypothetical protein
MRKLALTTLTVGLLSVPAAAQSNDNPQCPAGYYLVGNLCRDDSNGDIVLPNRAISCRTATLCCRTTKFGCRLYAVCRSTGMCMARAAAATCALSQADVVGDALPGAAVWSEPVSCRWSRRRR